MSQTLISGFVRDAASGAPLAGIIVSDGVNCYRSGADGSYRCDLAPEAEFLFVVVPGAYEALRSFWVDLRDPAGRPAQHDFLLQPRREGMPTTFSFVQVTDLHITTEQLLDDNPRAESAIVATDHRRFSGGIPASAVAEDLAEICRRHPDLAFVAITGDLTNRGMEAEFAAYADVARALPLPIAAPPGNHDSMSELFALMHAQGWPKVDFGHIDNDPGYAALGGAGPADAQAGRQAWLATLGPAYYAFWWGTLHVIVYDGDGQARHGARYPQERWLAAHLALLPPATPILLLLHFPPSPRQVALFAGRRLLASASGHWHCARVVRHDTSLHYSTPTLAFGGIDYSPRGYRLFHWDGQRLSSRLMRLDAAADESVAAPSSAGGGTLAARGTWPQFGGGAGRAGQAAALPPPLVCAWECALPGVTGLGSPVVADGLVLVASGHDDDADGGCLSAFAANDGALRWQAATGTSVKHSPAVADGVAVVVSVDGRVSAWSVEDGTPRWQRQLVPALTRWCYSAPLIHEGRVFVGSASRFVALDLATGACCWERDDLAGSDWIASYASPAALGDRVFVGFTWSPVALAAFDAASGATIWQLAGDIYHSPMASPVLIGEQVVLTRGNGAVECLEQVSGTLRWRATLDAPWTVATPASDGATLYVHSLAGTLSALALDDGALRWQRSFPSAQAARWPYRRQAGGQLGSPVLCGPWLYLACADGYLRALNRDGELLWQATTGAALCASPAATPAGLYLTTERRTLQAWQSQDIDDGR